MLMGREKTALPSPPIFHTLLEPAELQALMAAGREYMDKLREIWAPESLRVGPPSAPALQPPNLQTVGERVAISSAEAEVAQADYLKKKRVTCTVHTVEKLTSLDGRRAMFNF